MIISLVRLKTINEFTRATNPTSTSPTNLPVMAPHTWLTTLSEDIVQVCLWSGIELAVGVICPCLPSFRLLLRRLLPTVMGTSGRYELDPVTNPTGVTRSGARKSLGAGPGLEGGGGGGGGLGGGRILVENTFAVKYGSSDESVDASSTASVSGLVVEGRASAETDVSVGRKSR